MMTVIITGNTFAGATGGATYPTILAITPYGYGMPAGYTIKSVPFGTTPTGGAIVLYNPAYTTSTTLGASAIGSGYVSTRFIANSGNYTNRYEVTTIQAITNTKLGVVIISGPPVAPSSSYAGIFQAPGNFSFSTATQNLTFSFTATFPID